MRNGRLWNEEKPHSEPDTVTPPRDPRDAKQFQMKNFCDDNAKSQSNAGHFWGLCFVSFWLQECGRDSGMPKARLPSAWGTESQGDGYRSSRERAELQVQQLVIIMKLQKSPEAFLGCTGKHEWMLRAPLLGWMLKINNNTKQNTDRGGRWWTEGKVSEGFDSTPNT